MKKLKQLITITAISVLALPAVILANSIPESFSVRGNVTMDGQDAAVGTIISVEKDNKEIAVTTVTIEGRYLVEISAENTRETLIYKIDGFPFISKDTNPTGIPLSQNIDLVFIIADSNPDPDPVVYCGDGICNEDETCSTCSTDCGSCGGSSGGSASNSPVSNKPSPEETPKTPIVKGVSDVTVFDGDIIQCASSSNPFAVYIVKIVGDTKYIRHIVSLEIFNYYGHLRWENLKQVDSLNNYSMSGWVRHNTGPNGTAGPTDKVYEINGDQTKHWINMTAEDFLSHGGSEPAIYSVNQGELDLYVTGADVMSL